MTEENYESLMNHQGHLHNHEQRISELERKIVVWTEEIERKLRTVEDTVRQLTRGYR